MPISHTYRDIEEMKDPETPLNYGNRFLREMEFLQIKTSRSLVKGWPNAEEFWQ